MSIWSSIFGPSKATRKSAVSAWYVGQHLGLITDSLADRMNDAPLDESTRNLVLFARSLGRLFVHSAPSCSGELMSSESGFSDFHLALSDVAERKIGEFNEARDFLVSRLRAAEASYLLSDVLDTVFERMAGILKRQPAL